MRPSFIYTQRWCTSSNFKSNYDILSTEKIFVLIYSKISVFYVTTKCTADEMEVKSHNPTIVQRDGEMNGSTHTHLNAQRGTTEICVDL